MYTLEYNLSVERDPDLDINKEICILMTSKEPDGDDRGYHQGQEEYLFIEVVGT